ncbi:MAG: UDP-2,4-diacetamido-2,4,6-trideoxy-beta-L-altropyranose hydrolase [Gammaproteobacteria bacterium]|nr:UDP-2,4-diacetamido-2,4,6-trideoxy-beta-L-altropyranose hydrolase [Gammaproteobacteria bacterium]
MSYPVATKVYFRLDSNAHIGMGHLMRCLRLAKALDEYGFCSHFIVTEQSVGAVNMLQERGFGVMMIPVFQNQIEDAKACEKLLISANDDDYLVVDHYALDHEWERNFMSKGMRVVVIDDLANRSHKCHSLIDFGLHRHEEEYRVLCDESTMILTGANYILLDKRFREVKKQAAIKRKNLDVIKHVYLGFGGTDPNNLSVKCIRQLLGFSIIEKITVTTSRLNIHLDTLLNFSHDPRVHIHVESEKIADLLIEADLAIGSLGVSALERVCVGLPSICVVMADNQAGNASVMKAQGLAVVCDQATLDASIHQALQKDSLQRLIDMSSKCLQCIDGLGVDRVLHRAFSIRHEVEFREATSNDARPLYQLQCEDGARTYSRHPQVPSLEEHMQWFSQSMNNPDRRIWMLDFKGELAGFIRLDKTALGHEVSILISNQYQKLGLASSALSQLKTKSQLHRIIAYVLPENAASIKLFEGAHFHSIGDSYFEWVAS